MKTLPTVVELDMHSVHTNEEEEVKKVLVAVGKGKGKKKRISKKSKKSKPLSSPLLPTIQTNEPESEHDRIGSYNLTTESKKEKRAKKTSTTSKPTKDASEPANESLSTKKSIKTPTKTHAKKISSKKAQSAKSTSSCPEKAIISKKKHSKKSSSTKKSKKGKKTKKRKESCKEASEEDYFSDPFLFEMEEDETFTCLTEADIVAEQTKEIEEVAEILSVQHSAAITLLKHFKWNRDRLMTSYFDNPAKVIECAGVHETSLSPSVPRASVLPQASENISNQSNEEVECSICSMDVPRKEMYGLAQCGHEFCEDCWEMYLTIKINEGETFMHCAHVDCMEVVPEGSIRELVEAEIFQKYCTFFMQSFVDHNDNVKWCPAPGCGNAVTSDMVQGKTVTCRCSYQFCFQCSEEAHQPASCKEVKQWHKKCKDESETNNWIVANTQECPKCSLATEKNGGCNHMVCRQCKHEYCWICYKDWKGHNDYYNCNRFQKSEKKAKKNSRKEKEVERLATRRALEKYLHYHSRFTNHAHSKELEATSDKALQTMNSMQKTEATEGEVLFIRDATLQLLIARSVLKYSYVLRYYIDDEDPRANLLEYLQENLEKTAESLSQILNSPMQNKIEVVNLTGVTETRIHSILDAFDSS